MRLIILFLAAVLALSAHAAQETSTATATAASPDAKPGEPRGPLIEITPLNGGVSTGYLLAMKEGVIDVETTAGERKQEKTSELKSIRFIPPATAAPATPPAPAPDKPAPPVTPAPPRDLTPTQIKRSEDHKRLIDLLRKEHTGTKLTADEEKEVTELEEKVPLFKLFGGLTFVKQAHTAEADAKLFASQGKLDSYITQQRQALKDSPIELDARVHILRLASAYKQQNMHFVKMVEQLTKDIEQMTKETFRDRSLNQLQNLLEVMYMLSGEKPPR